MYREVNIERADMQGECDIDVAVSRNKIYVRNDTLVLTINNATGNTAIYSFDLVNNLTEERFISHPAADTYPAPVVYNSFLLNDKLYFASASKEAMNLQVADFYTGQKLKEFYATNREEISFKNTAIEKEGSKKSNDTTPNPAATKKILKEMTKGNVVIAGEWVYRENKVVLTIASYREIYNGGGMWMTGGGAIPVMYMPAGGFSSGSYVQSAHFKSILDATSQEHVAGELPALINDRVDEFNKDIKIHKTGENLYVLNGKYRYVYYDKKARTLNVVEFDR